jgi:REP element-mobilizing transposase RayT
MLKASEQLALGLPKPVPPRRHGGKREGAGRKPTRPGTWVEHRARPWHDRNHPVHVTLRVRKGIPSLRGFKLVRAIGTGLRLAATADGPRQLARRKTFRVIHFSIQPNHLHLIVEATSKTALARGMQGLASGLARRVNGKLHRRGSLFSDRYHAHALANPAEVRNAIVYVLKNYEKHPVAVPDRRTEPRDGIDPCSSARWFSGWAQPAAPPGDSPPVAAPHTWLLRVGWKRRTGLIRRSERPAIRPGSTRTQGRVKRP